MDFLRFVYISLFMYVIFADFDFEIDEEDSKPEEIGSMELFEYRSFVMGSHDKTFEVRGEYPARWEYTRPFRMDRYPVTVADFQNFVREKGYSTTQPDMTKYSYVFVRHVKKNLINYEKNYMVTEPWMIPVTGARWDKPHGLRINLTEIKYNPVVHVSFADAYRYCEHLNKRLPTEFEWELAARANNFSWNYPWGDRMRRNRMNIYQGRFPHHDHGYDGYTKVSPVNAFPSQNDHRMYDMIGNVWEWTTTEYYGSDLPHNEMRRNWVVLKGGSFLDTLNGEGNTSPVRCSIKIGRQYYYTAENVGFRCAQDANFLKNQRVIRFEDTREYRRRVEKLAKKFIVLKEKINRTVIQKPKVVTDHVHLFDYKDEL